MPSYRPAVIPVYTPAINLFGRLAAISVLSTMVPSRRRAMKWYCTSSPVAAVLRCRKRSSYHVVGTDIRLLDFIPQPVFIDILVYFSIILPFVPFGQCFICLLASPKADSESWPEAAASYVCLLVKACLLKVGKHNGRTRRQ